MITFKQYTEAMVKLLTKYPEFSELPVVYAEENIFADTFFYYKVNSLPTIAQFRYIEEDPVELMNYHNGNEDDEDNPAMSNINGVLIN